MSVAMTEKHGAIEISVVQIYGGDGDGAEIVLELNDKLIAVSVFPNHPTQNNHNAQREKHEKQAEDYLIDLLSRAATDCFGDDDDNDAEYDNIVNRVLNVILNAGERIFAKVAPTPTSSLSTHTLHSLLHPETVHFCFKTEHGKQLIVPIDASDAYSSSELQPDYDIDSQLSINGELPIFSSREINVLEVFVGRCVVSRVLVNGQEMLCKVRTTRSFDLNLERELIALLEIEKNHSKMTRAVRVPR